MTHLVENLTNNLKVYYNKKFKKKEIEQLVEKEIQDQVIEKTYESCCKNAQWFDELRSLVELDQKYLKVNEIFSNLNLDEQIINNNHNSNNNKNNSSNNSNNDHHINNNNNNNNSSSINSNNNNNNSNSSINDNNNNISNQHQHQHQHQHHHNSLKVIYTNNNNNKEDINLKIEENDKILISSILSKLSYFQDKETILQYLHSQISVTHVLEKIRKLYYFKPIHTRTKVLIAFDNQNNCYCSFNGTVNSSDLILDISCGFLEKVKFNCDDGVKHNLYSDCNRFEWAISIVEDLLLLTRKLGKKSLIFSGHSMGSTFATFACFEAIKLTSLSNLSNNPQLKCYSFGSPSFLHPTCKSFLDSNPQYNQIFENYINEYDIVPMMSHYPFIFIDFMYMLMFISTILFTIGYHLTTNVIQPLEKTIYNLAYALIMLTVPLFLTKLMYIIYQYFYSIGLQSKYTRVFNHKSGRFIFYESLDKDVEFNFKSIINHVKKLYNYKKFIMIDDHKMDRYLKHLYSCYQNNSKGSNPLNLLKSDDITYLQHSHKETIETSTTINSKRRILKKGLTILFTSYLIWLFISIPIFYNSLLYLINI